MPEERRTEKVSDQIRFDQIKSGSDDRFMRSRSDLGKSQSPNSEICPRLQASSISLFAQLSLSKHSIM
jgi:hypothetical protein